MAALYTVSDGDPADAADLNQLVSAFSNVLGVTDSSQSALGRLVLPNSIAASAPGTPVTGQMWLVTDEGESDGRLYVKHGTDIVPYLPIRQIKTSSSASTGGTITSTSYVDVSGLSLDIVTTGGWLRIKILPITGVGSGNGYIHASGDPGSENAGYQLRAVVGATNLGDVIAASNIGTANAPVLLLPISAFEWLYKPAPGSYTVKIQAQVDSDTSIQIIGALYVEEFGD